MEPNLPPTLTSEMSADIFKEDAKVDDFEEVETKASEIVLNTAR